MPLWDNWGDERGCDEGDLQAHTRGLPWGFPEVVGTAQQLHCSRRRLLWQGRQFHVCTINNSSNTKKVWKRIVCTTYINTIINSHKFHWLSPVVLIINRFRVLLRESRLTRHARHFWKSKNELITYVPLRTPSLCRACFGWPTWIYQQQLCADTVYSLEDLPEVMNDRDEWWGKVRESCARGTTWYTHTHTHTHTHIYIYIYI